MTKEKQSGIIRRPDFAGGGITDEERERMTAHSALWIERAFRTEPADPAIIEEAIKGIYVAANLAEPRVIVVPSPFVMAMAGGIASFWWYLFENKLLGKKRGASGDDLTFAPFYDDTFLTTYAAATYDATYDATLNTTLNATDTVTRDAVRAATYDATEAATSDASGTTEAATYGAIRAARQNWRALAASFVGEQWAQVALETAHCWETTYEGGNMWAERDSYLTAARDILGLRLSAHEAYAHWEQAAIHGGGDGPITTFASSPTSPKYCESTRAISHTPNSGRRIDGATDSRSGISMASALSNGWPSLILKTWTRAASLKSKTSIGAVSAFVEWVWNASSAHLPSVWPLKFGPA